MKKLISVLLIVVAMACPSPRAAASPDVVEDLNTLAKILQDVGKQLKEGNKGGQKAPDNNNGAEQPQRNAAPAPQYYNRPANVDQNRNKQKQAVPESTRESYLRHYRQQEEYTANSYKWVERRYDEVKQWELKHWEFDGSGRNNFQSAVKSYMQERRELRKWRKDAASFGVIIEPSQWEYKDVPRLKDWWNRHKP